MDLDMLWQMEDEFLRVPKWSTKVAPNRRNAKAATVFPEKKPTGSRATLQTSDGHDSDPSSLPPLEEASVYTSDSAAASLEDADESENGFSDSDGEESSVYDSEEEAELRDLLREAMDIASAHPEIFEEKKVFEEQSNDNQFLKALGALRGKYWNFTTAGRQLNIEM
jgi:hypothetical protein